MLSFGALFFSLVEIMMPRAPQAVVGGGQSRVGEEDSQTQLWGDPVSGAGGEGEGKNAQKQPRETEVERRATPGPPRMPSGPA
jgi:hypothetical protein